MGFDDFIEHKKAYDGSYSKRKYRNDSEYFNEFHHSRYKYHGHFNWFNILDKIRSNKRLRQFIIIAVILVIVIGVTLIAVLLPLIVKLFNYIVQNGLQGVYNDIAGFLEKIWKGSGN